MWPIPADQITPCKAANARGDAGVADRFGDVQTAIALSRTLFAYSKRQSNTTGITLSHATALRLAILLLTATASITAIAKSPVCGRGQTTHEGVVPLASMPSATPLYLTDATGRLLKMDLRISRKSVLSNHGFSTMPTLRPSADGRWLSYSGVLKKAATTQYWLYDRHQQTDELIYEHPAGGTAIVPRFSPDSRYLAISAPHTMYWPDASRAGIYLFDTTTRQLLAVPLPALEKDRTTWVSADWSQDGTALLILVNNDSADDGKDYFSYRIADRQIEKLSGRWNKENFSREFLRDEKIVPVLEDFPARSASSARSAWSPAGNWHAHFDKGPSAPPFQLKFTSKEGVTTGATVGRYDRCQGIFIKVSGWLDERHLVYRNAMTFFMYDAETGKTAVLFNSNELPVTFTW